MQTLPVGGCVQLVRASAYTYAVSKGAAALARQAVHGAGVASGMAVKGASRRTMTSPDAVAMSSGCLAPGCTT